MLRRSNKWLHRVIVAFFAVVILLSVSMVTVFAAQKLDIKKDDMKNNSVTSGGILYNTAPSPSYDFKNVNGESVDIGIDALYGSDNRDSTYNGEVPGNNEDYKDKPKFATGYVDVIKRKWFFDPKSINEKLNWNSGSTNDIHAIGLQDKNKNWFSPIFDGLVNGGSGIGFLIASILNAVFGAILTFFIRIGNMDLAHIDLIRNLPIAKTLTTILIGDGKSFSPIFILSVAISIIGMVALAIKNITSGTESFKKIAQEFIIFVIAMVLVGVSLNGSYDKLMDATKNFSNNAVTSINKDIGNKIKLFAYSTGNSEEDINNTMIALTKKPFIDIVIKQQFGYNVNELDLYGEGVDTQKLWGISPERMKELVAATYSFEQENGVAQVVNYLVQQLTGTQVQNNSNSNNGNNSSNISLFSVSTGTSNNNDAPNLGYFWYAASTGVDNMNPISNDNGWHFNYGSKDRVLFIMDLLSSIDAEVGGSPKAQAIMKSFQNHHNYWLEMLMIGFVTVAEVYAIAFVAIVSMISKLIFNVGFMFIPFFPIMLLIPNLRDTARKAMNTWINSAVRMVLAQAIMLIIIYTSTSLTSYGEVSGYIIDIIVLIGFGRFAPILLMKINEIVSASRDQLQTARSIDSRLNSMADSYSRNNNTFDRINAIKRRRDMLDGEKAGQETDNEVDYSTETTRNSDDMLNRYKLTNAGKENKSEDPDSAKENVSVDNDGNNAKGISNLDIDRIKLTKEYLDEQDRYNKDYKAINKMSEYDLAKSLGIESDELKNITATEKAIEETIEDNKQIDNDRRNSFNKFMTSKPMEAISMTKLGGIVANKIQESGDNYFDKKEQNHHLSKKDRDLRRKNIEAKKKEMDRKVIYKGEEMTLKAALKAGKREKLRDADNVARKNIMNIVIDKTKEFKQNIAGEQKQQEQVQEKKKNDGNFRMGKEDEK